MELNLEQYHPTNTTTHRHAVDRWFNFIAGFSPEFVTACIEGSPSKRRTVLDPFTGCGTVQVQANKMEWESFGYEPHPFFFRIACAKAFSKSPSEILRIKQVIGKGFDKPVSIEQLKDKPREFLSKLFNVATLEQLIGARDQLVEAGLGQNDLAFLVLSKVLDLCSKSQTDGIYKAPTSSKRAHAPHAALLDVCEMIAVDLNEYKYTKSSIFQSSSESMRDVQDESVSMVITSPPYLNNFDFAEMTRMQLYFWDIADSWGDISRKVRSKLIVNTTTALNGHKARQEEYRDTLPKSILSEIDDVVSVLEGERRVRAGKKEYDFLIYPYFSQMQEVLVECFRSLERGGRFHMMVADAALYGVHISSPQILAQIMEGIGFKRVECELVRRRGHRWILNKRDGSKKGLGEYHVYAEKP